MAKLIRVDNFASETRDDFLVADSLSETQAESMAKHLNSQEHADGPDYYRVVPDEYILHKWEP
jgi:hypothetical protein